MNEIWYLVMGLLSIYVICLTTSLLKILYRAKNDDDPFLDFRKILEEAKKSPNKKK